MTEQKGLVLGLPSKVNVIQYVKKSMWHRMFKLACRVKMNGWEKEQKVEEVNEP